jgi:hypothetical protein
MFAATSAFRQMLELVRDRRNGKIRNRMPRASLAFHAYLWFLLTLGRRSNSCRIELGKQEWSRMSQVAVTVFFLLQ